MAIKISLKRSEEGYDLLRSKCFGAPVIPNEWLNDFPDEVIFFGQINLKEIAELDKEHKLPHTGYLYLFLDTEIYPYTAWVKYYDGEPNTVVDDFNEIEERFSHLNQAFVMEFEPCDDSYEGTKLFGEPTFCLDEERKVLLQFDPLDNDTGFLSEIDGYAYFLFPEDEDLEGIEFAIEQS